MRRPIEYHLRMFDGLLARVARVARVTGVTSLRRLDYRVGVRLLMDVYDIEPELLSDAAKVAVTMQVLESFRGKI